MNTRLSMYGRSIRRSFGVIAFVAASALLVSGAAWGVSASARAAAADRVGASPAAAVASPAAGTSYADAVSHAAPAVVIVQVERRVEKMPAIALPDDDLFRRFFRDDDLPRGFRGPRGGRGPAPVEQGLGSGVIVGEDGSILTNNHVVEGAARVKVTLVDGREFEAKVVGTDPATDLAVLHVDAKSLPTLPLADSDRVRVGDVVLALGNPLGIGQTVTMGIVSAKGRSTHVGDGSYEDFLQTDAPINRGNSGGALITAAGQLVGINSQIVSPSGGNIGIGFAIPSNMARHVMNQLVAHGRVRRAMLGVTVQPVTSDMAKSLGLSRVSGALVNTVTPDGPGAKAGIERGDVILSVDGQGVDGANELRNRVSSMAPGSRVTLAIERGGRERTLQVVLGELPDKTHRDSKRSADAGALGLTLEPLTPDLADRLNVGRGTNGVAVTDVDPAGAAARAGIQTGDVVREVNGQAVRTPGEFRGALAGRTGRPALVFVQRGDASFYLTLPANS